MYIESIDENKELLRKVLHDYINTLSEDQLRSMLISDKIEEDVSTERNQTIDLQKNTQFLNYPQD